MHLFISVFTNDIIVRSLHVQRTLLGLTIGMSLGLAGAVMQGVTRNPLADPGILGVNAGASLAIVLAVFSLKIVSPAGSVWFYLARRSHGQRACLRAGFTGADKAQLR